MAFIDQTRRYLEKLDARLDEAFDEPDYYFMLPSERLSIRKAVERQEGRDKRRDLERQLDTARQQRRLENNA